MFDITIIGAGVKGLQARSEVLDSRTKVIGCYSFVSVDSGDYTSTVHLITFCSQ